MSVQTADRISPEVPLQIITPELVRKSIKRARKSLEDAAKEIIWQIEREAWVTLGYSSWGAMREHEYGGAAFVVPGKNRPEIVERIKAIEIGRTARGNAKHLTNKEIAMTVGISETQVREDLHGYKNVEKDAFVESHDDIIDAEIVEEDEPVNYETGEIIDQKETDPTIAESATPVACPTCHGTGKVTP